MQRFIIALLAIPALLFGQDSLNISRVGGIFNWGQAHWVSIGGSYAYVACGTGGLRVLDITYPTDPIEVASYDTPGACNSVAVAGHYAYVGSGSGAVEVGSSGFSIFDISTPSAPHLVGSIDLSGAEQDVVLYGNFALVNNHKLSIVDISNVSNPVEVGAYDSLTDIAHFTVSGSYVYVMQGGLQGLVVLDISDPTQPVNAMESEEAIWGRDIAISGNYAYIVQYDSLKVLDISYPPIPQIVNVITVASNWPRITIQDNKAFVSRGQAGMSIFDLSDPVHPVEIGTFDSRGSAERVTVDNGIAYLAGGPEGISIINVANPSNPHELASYDRMSYCNSLAVSGDYAFISAYNNGAIVVDISNQYEPVVVEQFLTESACLEIAVSEGLCFATTNQKLYVLDASNPEALTELGQLQIQELTTSVAVNEYFVYLTDWLGGLHIIDVSNPALPVERSNFTTGEEATAVEVADGRAYVSQGLVGFAIVDISNPDDPYLLGQMDTQDFATDIAIEGNIAYVSDGNDGIRAYDVSDPSSLTELSLFELPWGAWRLSVNESNVFAVDPYSGFYVLDYADPANPYMSGFYPKREGRDVAVGGSYAYASEGRYFSIYDVSAALSTPEEHNSIVTNFAFHPIYPNPFNNTANIAFDLPREVTGRLVVYDVMGRMTNTLYDGKLAAGSHQMQLNAGTLSSGAYFVRLETPSFSATQKAVLLK